MRSNCKLRYHHNAFVKPSNAIRTSKIRTRAPGSSFDAHEQGTIRRKLRDLLAGARTRAKAKAKPKPKSAATIPLLANVLTQRALDRTLTISAGLDGIAAFMLPGRPSVPLRDGESRRMLSAAQLPEAACQHGESYRSCVYFEDGRNGCLEVRRVDHRELHTIADCGSTGFTGCLWNNTLGGIVGTHSSDVYAHDCNNSVKRAVIRSGLWLLVLEHGLVANFRRAPFNTGENHLKFAQAGADLFAFIRSSNYTQELWLDFYPDIAQQLKVWDSEPEKQHTVEHMEMTLGVAEAYLGTAGQTVKLARWFAVWDRIDERGMKDNALTLMVLLWRGFHSTWPEAAADLWLYWNSMTAPAALNETGAPLSSDVPRTVKESGEIFNRLKGTTCGHEHTVALILSNRLGCRVMVMLSTFIHPTRKRHGEALVAAKTPRGAEAWRIADATGAWEDELWDLVESTVSDSLLRQATFLNLERYDAAGEDEFHIDNDLACVAHRFLIHLLASRILFYSVVEYSFPWRAASLLTEGEKLKSNLNVFASWWWYLQILEEECKTDPDARSLRTKMVWPLWEWAVRIFVILAEHDFKEVFIDSKIVGIGSTSLDLSPT